MKRARNIKSPFFFELPPLKNVGKCVILHSSAPGNRMGEMSWHLAGQRVGRTARPPIFFYCVFMPLPRPMKSEWKRMQNSLPICRSPSWKMSANVIYYIHRHRGTGWVRCSCISQGSVFAPRLLADFFYCLYYIAFWRKSQVFCKN